MRAFITGITGFAGAHLAEWLIAQGDSVAGSNSRGAWPAELAASPARQAPLMAWDLAETAQRAASGEQHVVSAQTGDAIREFGPEVIFHLAALSVPAECGEQTPTPRALAINVAGTKAVLHLAATLPNRPRIVFVSSGHVYGSRTPSERWVAEDSPLCPASAYAQTKCAAEREVLDAVQHGQVDAVIARAFKHAGPRQDARMMLTEWCRQFARGCSPVKVRCLDSHLDLTDVRDVVRAYRLLAIHGETGGIYNVGSGQSVRTGDLFEQLRAMADPTRPYSETAPGVRWETIAVIDRLVAATGWRPAIPLETTLRDTLRHEQEHQAAGRSSEPRQ